MTPVVLIRGEGLLPHCILENTFLRGIYVAKCFYVIFVEKFDKIFPYRY
jgi:hypothetical protein